jgi:hypothetical protein
VRKFQHNAFAIKTQEGGPSDFFNGRVVTRMARTPSSPACKKVLADAEKK